MGRHGHTKDQTAIWESSYKHFTTDLLLDEMNCSQVAVEIEQQAWDSYLKRDFIDAIEKRFKADYSDPNEEELHALYFELLEKTNLFAEIVGGGNVRINISRLVDAITEPPAFLKLEWW